MSLDNRPSAQPLVDDALTTERVARDIIGWVDRNEPIVQQDRNGLLKDFRRFSATASRLATAASRPMCVGVFGPSQNGKSHLIATLARKLGSEAMMVRLGDHTEDFIKSINPEGKKESTGLVTRFSLRPFSAAKAYGPVPLRLLSQTDIIKIIGNFYYKDVNSADAEPPAAEELEDLLGSVAGAAASQPVDTLTADDVFDLQDYFERYFGSQQRIRQLRKSFWDEAAALAPRLQIADRARLFGVIWDSVPEFTALYARLYRALQRLGFSANAFAGLDALMPRQTSIIAVDTLQGLGSDQPETVQFVGENGVPVSLSRCDAAAIVAELHLQITEKPHEFLDHADLLDFPGARSRLDITAGKLRDTPENLSLLFRRGKVGYLFERYCADKELTSMLLCINDEVPNITSLPEVINDWISTTHGATPDQRSQVRTALFFVLTFFDRAFQTNVGEGSPESRWTTRLATSLTDFFGLQHDWPKMWDNRGPFRNCFWFRNTTFLSEDLFDYDQQTSREIQVRDVKRDRVAELKRGFLVASEANQYFTNPSKAYDAGLALNDGGASYLAESLIPICDAELKNEQIRAQLRRLRASMADRISPWFIGGNPEQEMQRRLTAARGVAQDLIQCATAQRFGQLVSQLHVIEEDLEDIYYRIELGLSAGPNAADTVIGQRPAELEMAEAIFGTEDVNVGNRPPLQDDAQQFAETVIASWIRDLHDLAANEGFCEQVKLSPAAMRDLVKELVEGAKRLGLENRIAHTVRTATPVRMKFQRLVKLPVRLSAQIINAYVNQLGYDAMSVAERPRTKSRLGSRPIFLAPEPPRGIPQIPDEPARFDQSYYTDWIVGFLDLVQRNAGTSGDLVLNVEANTQLASYLASLGQDARTLARHV